MLADQGDIHRADEILCFASPRNPWSMPTVHATLLAAATAARRPEPAAAASATTGPSPDGLTERELEILSLIARGLTNPEIAAQLFLSNHTIKTHIGRIFAKTGSRDRAAAIGYAHRYNIG